MHWTLWLLLGIVIGVVGYHVATTVYWYRVWRS
jgi:hypothetical protein